MPLPRRSPHRDEQGLFSELLDPALVDNVRLWVQTAFRWGEHGTPLHDQREPRKWQIERFEEVSDFIRMQKYRVLVGDELERFQEAISGGRGVGKTACDMILAYWFFSTQLGGTVLVSANNEEQLKTNIWAELGVWHTAAINSHWFERATMTLLPVAWFKKMIQEQLAIDTGYYEFVGKLWDADRPTAYVGPHNRYGLFLSFQEAIGIPKCIWTAGKGMFTDKTTHRFWLATSNMRASTGAFVDCFRSERNEWRLRVIDSRTVEGVDRKVCDEILAEFGEDSAEACAEVTGEIPGEEDDQFISRKLIEAAAHRELPPLDEGAPTIIGVDVARKGKNKSVIRVRKGRDARSIPEIAMQGADNVAVARRVVEVQEELRARGWRPKVCIDSGYGSGVIDILASWGHKVIEVEFGGAADDAKRFKNKRAEMGSRCRKWLEFGCIENLRALKDDLAAPKKAYSDQGDGGVLVLESKEAMADRGLPSPDHGDALWLTFAISGAREDSDGPRGAQAPQGARIALHTGCDPW